MLSRKYLLSLFGLFPVLLLGQSTLVRGTVVNDTGAEISYANVIAAADDQLKDIVAYAVSDDGGWFEMKIVDRVDSIYLNASAIGYKHTLVGFAIDETLQAVQIVLSPNSVGLKEIIVKAVKIQADTLNIDLQNMNLSADDNLQKILENTGGIVLGKDGSIIYQGKRITKININGKEVFINQNKIALEHLTYELMDSLQIVDNYKSKFSLDFNKIRDPVISITTKDEFRGIIKGEVTAGAGHHERFLVGAKVFHFSDRFNAFAISQSNNYGEISLDQSSVYTPLQRYGSAMQGKFLIPYFSQIRRNYRNVVSTNSITLRKESARGRTSIVAYHGYNSTGSKQITKDLSMDTLLRSTERDAEQRGHYYAAQVDHIEKLGKNTLFTSQVDLLGTSMTTDSRLLSTVYHPARRRADERISTQPQSIAFHSEQLLQRILAHNCILKASAGFYYESLRERLHSLLADQSGDFLEQFLKSSRTNAMFSQSLQFQLQRSSLTAGIDWQWQEDNHELHRAPGVQESSIVERKKHRFGLPVRYEGVRQKFNYLLSVNPTLFLIGGRQNIHPQTYGLLSYKFQAQQVLSASYVSNVELIDLSPLQPVNAASINSITRSPLEGVSLTTRRKTCSINYTLNNVSKSQNIYIAYNFNHEADFVQRTLDSISGNMVFYSLGLVDNKNSHGGVVTGRKGFYYGEAFNMLTIGLDAKVNLAEYPVRLGGNISTASTLYWEPGLSLQLIPRKIGFIDEVKNRLSRSRQRFSLNENLISQQQIWHNSTRMEGRIGKLEYELTIDFHHYNVDGNRFGVPDIDTEIKYRLTPNWALSVSGSSLLTLFDLNDFNSVNTFAEGNTITQVYNDNVLAYLLTKVTYKL